MNISTEIVDLNNCNKFFNFLQSEKQNSTDRNVGWFDEVRYRTIADEYPLIVMSLLNNKVFGFSIVQKHNFPKHVYRIMSRLYVAKEFRSMEGMKYIHNKDNLHAPSSYLLQPQLDFCMNNDDCKWIIFTMEHVNRRRPIQTITKYFNRNFNTNFDVLANMYKTYDKEDDWQAWQNCSLYNLCQEQLPIKSLTVSEWKERFGNPKLVGDSF